MITIDKSNKAELRGFRFCAIALWNKKELSYHGDCLRYLHIKDGVVTATDGHRIHFFTTGLEIEPGLYEVVRNTKTEVKIAKTDKELTDYPDFTVLEPNTNPETTTIIKVDNTYTGSSSAFCKFIQAVNEEGFGLNFGYFMELGIDEERCFDVSFYTTGGPIKFECEGYKALIMPIRIQEVV